MVRLSLLYSFSKSTVQAQCVQASLQENIGSLDW